MWDDDDDENLGAMEQGLVEVCAVSCPSSRTACDEQDRADVAASREFFAGDLVRFVHPMLRRTATAHGYGLVAQGDVTSRTCLLTAVVFAAGTTRRERLAGVLAKRNDPNYKRFLAMACVEGLCRNEVTPSLLKKHSEVDAAEIARLMDIIGTNDHGPGLWIETAAANHSCDNNARLRFSPDQREMSIVTIKPVLLGDEVTFCYLEQKLHRESRRRMLKKGWGFDCACRLCASGK
eukprot:TRINITY_DN17209_c0_g1_i1.p1 TRINITY_DN17209_c0_g1~~TRINITY_DN17209_c0_g1_i1.p1  ORF type:complete len:235 (+),score=30.96 TRINITY_DN17209_c0_g1_i1:100-804(+)